MVSKELCYVAKGVNRLLLSITSGIISNDFPSISSSADNVSVNSCAQADEGDQCSCPKGTPTPPAPSQLPYTATEENIPKLKEWILDYYVGSAFNCCQNQELPLVNDIAPITHYSSSISKC